jgi:hypothetical protein
MKAAAMSRIPRLPDTFRWRLAIGAVLIAGSYLAWLIIPLVVSSSLSPKVKTALTAVLGAMRWRPKSLPLRCSAGRRSTT